MSRSVGFLVAFAAGLSLVSSHAANAKTPGHEYCFHGTCHRVKTLEETQRLIGITTKLKASYYDDPKHDGYNPSNLTSSGEYFRADRPDNAASPIYPDGTKLLVWHPVSRRALMIRVNNAGPYWGDRKLDLSRAAAERFGITKSGTAMLHVQVIEAPTKAEATYRKGRTYPPVRGYLGQFATMEAAADGAVIAPTIRLAENEVPKPIPEAVLSPAPKNAPPTVERAGVVVAAHRAPEGQPLRLTELDVKLIAQVEREARKFLVAEK